MRGAFVMDAGPGSESLSQAARLAAEVLRLGMPELRCCAMEGRPARRARAVSGILLDDPGKVARRMSRLRGLRKEHVVALYVNARHCELRQEIVSVGTLTASLIHPREIFGPAIACSAAGVLVVHNHPSGDPGPSPEDREVTTRLVRAGEILGIPLVDHVIVAEGGHYSFREHGLL